MPLGCMPARTDIVRTLDHAAIGAAYAKIGGVFAHSTRMLRLVNLTDGDLMFSDDGVNDKWPVPHGSFVLYDYAANSTTPEANMVYPQGTQIWAKQVTAVTGGAAYVECTYAQGQ